MATLCHSCGQPRPPKLCKSCGEVIVGKALNAQFCAECSAERMEASTRRYRQRLIAKAKAYDRVMNEST